MESFLKRVRSSPSPNKDGLMKKICVTKQNSPKKLAALVEMDSTVPKVEWNENISDLFDDDDDFMFLDENVENNLPENRNNKNSIDLSNWNRCTVQTVERDSKNSDLILKLFVIGNTNKLTDAIVRLQGPWCHLKIEINDPISILATWNETFGSFVVNKDFGFVVTNPDFLISGTTVVGSLFCRRKAVLQDKFRGIDVDSKIMVIGSIIHELLQAVLTKKLKTYKEIEVEALSFLKSNDMVFMLYSSKMTPIEAQIEIRKFLPNIHKFIRQYVLGKDGNESNADYFQGTIDCIQDIEENLWVPQLGLKGKIDVSVRVNRTSKKSISLGSNSTLMPLELKTGRSSFSMEHKGQVIIYQMMLTEIGEKTNSGLLLYLKDGVMKEILASRNEKRDLIILRNELSYYLTRNLKLTENLLDKLDQKFQNFHLPEPINHNFCTKCPYNIICSTFLLNDKSIQLSKDHPMSKISKECTSHLKEKDFEYFILWYSLLLIEEQEIKNEMKLNAFWNESAEERRNKGRAIINLKIVGNIESNDGKFIHTFMLDNPLEGSESRKKIDFTISMISLGDYVIVSSTRRTAIAAGHVNDITKNKICLSLERNLAQNYLNEMFIVDKHESQSNNVFNYTNLGLLLDSTEKSNYLRNIIINFSKPEYSNSVPKIIAKEGLEILANLNSVQRKAVLKAMTTNSYMLIKGLPGTGKTQTLVAIIRLFHLIGKTILITSHTHSAIDNILLRLKDHNLNFLRLGTEARVNQQLKEYSEHSVIPKNLSSPDELSKIYSSYSIIGVTCLGTSHPIFTYRDSFDICIVDEATQVYQATIIRPLYYAKKFILVGDPDQLPPLVRSKKAQKLGASQSLFHRLDSSEATYELNLQYRMNKTITKLANDLTYCGKLICGNDVVQQAVLELPQKIKLQQNVSTKKWILRVLEKHIDQSVMLIDTGNCLNTSILFSESIKLDPSLVLEKTFSEPGLITNNPKRKTRYTNYCEGAIVFQIVQALLSGGMLANKIGIIAPYRAQVELLKKLRDDINDRHKSTNSVIYFDGLEVNTVDQYQGRDKEVILYSCCKTGSAIENDCNKDNEILEDRRRLTVAITRSKHKLIIIGDEVCLKQFTPFRDLFEKIPGRSKLKLENNKIGFSWDAVLRELAEIM